MKKIISLLIILTLSLSLIGCEYIEDLLNEGKAEEVVDLSSPDNKQLEEDNHLDEDGYYTGKEEVALYIHSFNRLPKNFISKKEAMDLAWDSKKANLWDVTDKKSIGGDRFGNRESRLPKKEGRVYYECDINYEGGFRGPERLVYSNDGLIYYTGDHYESFTLLYGDE